MAAAAAGYGGSSSLSPPSSRACCFVIGACACRFLFPFLLRDDFLLVAAEFQMKMVQSR
jgi:hypothetical protein